MVHLAVQLLPLERGLSALNDLLDVVLRVLEQGQTVGGLLGHADGVIHHEADVHTLLIKIDEIIFELRSSNIQVSMPLQSTL